MGHGPGFRKVRRELGVTAFGVNAVVIPPGFTSHRHLHERQEAVYVCVGGAGGYVGREGIQADA